MSGVFHFRCSTPSYPHYHAVLVLFAGPTKYDRNAVTDAITEETRRALAPEAAFLLYPKVCADVAAEDLAKSPEVFAPLTEDAPIGIYQYDGGGIVSLHTALRGSPASALPLDQVRRQGLTTLFRRRGAALDAGPTAYFIRPSARPSSRFLRASHALSDGAEIFFAALWILPHISADVEYVHLDTSAIASVVLAALILKKPVSQPTILTFHSYEGIEHHPFSLDRPELVIISASQTGSMARDVIGRVADPTRVITLFSSADPPLNSKVICDIRSDAIENPDGYVEPRKVNDVSGSRPVRLISEHFIAPPEPPRAIVPVKNDAPPIVKDVLAQLAGRKVIRALRRTDIGDARSSAWFDMEALLAVPLFQRWVERVVNQAIPATTRAVVQLEPDQQATVVRDAILKAIKAQGGDLVDVRRLTLDEIEAGSIDWSDPKSPIVITGSTSGRGTQLLAASRALRRFAPDSHRIFLCPGTISTSKRSIDLLRRNLQQPNFRFETMFELVIDREVAAESWREERLLLEDLQRGSTIGSLEERIKSLSGEPDGRLNHLFLCSPLGPLRLRANFAFWPADALCAEASQADVFTTICAILENLRSDSSPLDRRLINEVQTHTVIDPETFARYNDGIIQASFLRAARRVELNYRDSTESSRLMLDLVVQMIRQRERQQGEALAEFLLAIATGRLRLTDDDFARLKQELALKIDGASELAVWLADRIVNHTNKLPIGGSLPGNIVAPPN